MNIKKEIMLNDMNYICCKSNVDFSRFDGKTILITGATGLIGFTLVSAFMYYSETSMNPPNVIALVRNKEKADTMYNSCLKKNLKFVIADIVAEFQVQEEIDYIIHGASQTASKAFVTEPVETIKTALIGTERMLKIAMEKKVKGFAYLSSMEVYGTPVRDDKISEQGATNLDTMLVRSSYPESKRMCESLCTAYYHEYAVPTKVIRLTQTVGPGVKYDDSRVFAEFARCALEGKDIILHTRGLTKRNYLYTADAVTAILTVLLDGKNSDAYNAANENTYCSIYEMAKLVTSLDESMKIRVKVIEDSNAQYGYAPELHMNLDTSKLKLLGWEPSVDLSTMYQNLCYTMSEKN